MKARFCSSADWLDIIEHVFVPAIDLGSAPLTISGVALAEARAYRRIVAQAEACELEAVARYLVPDTDIDDARVLEVAAVFTVSEMPRGHGWNWR